MISAPPSKRDIVTATDLQLTDSRTVRVLLVDDEESVRTATARLLRGLGYDVREALNAVDALRALDSAQGKIQTVVTDMVMPHMSGSDLAHEIFMRYPECAVVMVSGYMRGGTLDDELRERAVFVEKPFTLESLTTGIREAQRKRKHVGVSASEPTAGSA